MVTQFETHSGEVHMRQEQYRAPHGARLRGLGGATGDGEKGKPLLTLAE
jgi:hypothetical protein